MNTSMVYGERIGCTIESSWKLVDCIRKGRSWGELASIEFKPEIGTWPWAPVVQERFFHFDQELFDHCPDHVSLQGYFQTEKYF